MLFGSVLSDAAFRESSALDLAAWGLSQAHY
jgi:hypothetical protein